MTMKIGFTANGYMDKKEDFSAYSGGRCVVRLVNRLWRYTFPLKI